MAPAPMLVTATIIVTSNVSVELVEGIGIIAEGVEKLNDDDE